MIKKLRVKNFKCFREEKEFDFGRITLLLGANSSGKSSVMYAILGAIQSDEFPFQFSPNGRFVNMGDFGDMVWGHEIEREIEIGLEIRGYSPFRVVAVMGYDSRNMPEIQFSRLALSTCDLELRKIPTGSFQVSIVAKDFPNQLESWPLEDEQLRKQWVEYGFFEASMKGKSFAPIVFEIQNIDQLIAHISQLVPDHKWDGYKNAPFAFWLGILLPSVANKPFSAMNFISSFRLHPERTYYESTKSSLRVEKFGENYLDQIMLWDAKYPEKSKYLLDWMNEMELITDMKANRIGGGRYDVQVKTKEKGVFAALSDVGFGLSQFLPILVADLQLPDDSTLFIQQPESQLHPSVQANFGDYLTKQVTQTQKNYVVETHSEYLLNRIRLNIVKGTLKPEDLQVYFLESEEDDTAVHRITFAKNGQILGAPESFFTTYEMDVMEIAINAVGE